MIGIQRLGYVQVKIQIGDPRQRGLVNYLPKAPPSNAITLGVRASTH